MTSPSRDAHVVAWFLVGVVVGGFLIVTQARAVGGVAGLLEVGETSRMRPMIESELGDIPLVEGGGHDGQIAYGIGLDLLGRHVPDFLDDAGYRYRRILYPALASLFGWLDGRALLYGMIGLNIVGIGLATAAVAAIGGHLGTRSGVVAGVLANPGVWLGVRLLTPDVFGLGLALSGLALALRRRTVWAVILLAAAALSKDQFLLVAWSTGAFLWRSDRRAAVRSTLVPTVALAAWAAALAVRSFGAFSPRGNLTLPFLGVWRAFDTWSYAPGREVVLGVVALVAVAACAALLIRSRSTLIRLLGWPWVALAVVSSAWVWNFGNNAARAFAIVGVVIALAAASPQDQPIPLMRSTP